MIEVGATAFFHCPKNSWIPGVVEGWDGKTAIVRPSEPGAGRESIKVTESGLFVARDEILQEDVNDLLDLTVLHDSTLLNCLRRRFARDVIYTNIGAIVVAINPFKFDIPAYMEDKMPLYLAEGEVVERQLPHSWAVAHNTYYELRNDKVNQSVLVSGESGAGKTEATKIVMKYLAAISCKEGGAEQKEAGRLVGIKINQTSPVLECFGNAKTVRNDNSSRFGKFMKVKFDSAGYLVGASVVKYLLEKSRIVTAAEGERCYHSLYLICRGAHAAMFGVESDKDFRTLTSGNCLQNKEYDSPGECDEVNGAMALIGITDTERDSIWAVVAAVLHLGNVLFVEDGEGSSVNPKSDFNLSTSAALLQVNPDSLRAEMLKTQLTIAGQTITKLLKPILAQDAKEALMKALYDALFQWIVDKCNGMLDVTAECAWVGLLDIFGFEMFETNSFEQLCINLANESLQHHYNTYIFERDVEECRAEGVDMSMVAFPDNAGCIQMITGKGGILALLDEECSLGKGTDESFLEKTCAAHQGNPFFLKKALQKSSFTVIHYAGDVTYTVAGFLEKNRDTIKEAFKVLVSSSANALIATLLSPQAEQRKSSVGNFFKNQLKELMELLSSTNPHWIRCIKPHPAKKPGMWHGPNVMSQLSSSGVLGTVQIRKAGYPVRIKVGDFLARYSLLGKTVEEIWQSVKVEKGAAQKGTKRVFLKSDVFAALEHKKKAALLSHTKVVQAFGVALIEHAIVRQKQRLMNAALYERLRVAAKKLLALQDEEEHCRAQRQEQLWAARDDLVRTFLTKSQELLKVIRQRQLERQRQEFERQEREQAAKRERERLLQQRREMLAKRKKEQDDRLNELRKINLQLDRALQKKLEEEAAQTSALHNQMEAYFFTKAQQLLESRAAKWHEEKQKRERVKQKRIQAESERSRLALSIAQRTEQLQQKGEVLKAFHEFELQQQREQRELVIAARKKEAAARLEEERRRKTEFVAVQSAVSDARCAFLKAIRTQVQKDNCAHQHLLHIERHEEATDMDLVRERLQRKHSSTGDGDVSSILALKRQLERRVASGSAHSPNAAGARALADADDVTKKLGPPTIPSIEISTVTEFVAKGLRSNTKTARKHRDPTLPPDIEPELYRRLAGSTPDIIAQYSTAAALVAPSCLVPWKI